MTTGHALKRGSFFFMEIKDFVKATITQITEAIEELNQELASRETIVNPRGLDQHSGGVPIGGDRATLSHTAQIIEFDLLLQVTEGHGSGGRLGIFTSWVGLGGESKTEMENAAASRIKFSIPVVFPSSSL